MKNCIGCGERKPAADYYKHPGMKDGRLGRCKECMKAGVRANRAKKIEYYRAYDMRRYRDNPDRRERLRRWGDTVTPEASAAHRALGYAVRTGKIKRPLQCSLCNIKPPRRGLHGHHADYSKPLEVVWLCISCHRKHHNPTCPPHKQKP